MIYTPKWVSKLATRWNSQTYATFILHGNIYDIFPIQNKNEIEYVSLKSFLSMRIFSSRDFLLFYDVADGIGFGTQAMKGEFFKWLEIYDETEKTNYHYGDLPKTFVDIVPIMRRFFMYAKENKKSVTLVIDFAEKIVPSSENNTLSNQERMAVVSLLKWSNSSSIRTSDIGIFLISETIGEIHGDIVRNPHFAQISIDLPDKEERKEFLNSDWAKNLMGKIENNGLSKTSDIDLESLAARTSGLNLVRIQHLLGEAIHNNQKITWEYVASKKKGLIEEYCQGLVKFIEPKTELNLDCVATHIAAKKKLREIAWLIKNNKTSVLERGVLLPGRVGVGKSYLVKCFASECGLPALEIGDFRSKWVGDSEKAQSRILMTIIALGPVIVVIDEADAALGNRNSSGDSGVSSRVFAGFAAHIGDSSLRGRELWIAMTSRPDLMAIDMKRQGRFGLCIPLFASQSNEDIIDLFEVQCKINNISFSEEIKQTIIDCFKDIRITGSDTEAIVVRAKEIAVLNKRDNDVTGQDFAEAAKSFIDPLDPNLIMLQELAAVLSCSDSRYLPEKYKNMNREDMYAQYSYLKKSLEN